MTLFYYKQLGGKKVVFFISLPQQRKNEDYDLNCLKMFYYSLGLAKLLVQTQLLLNVL